MSELLTFGSIEDAKIYLSKQRNGRERFLFFRGEANYHPLCTPSLYRETTTLLKKDIDDFDDNLYFLQNLFLDLLANHIVDNIYKQNELIGDTFVKLSQAREWSDYYNGSHPSVANLRNQVVCLLQHYGWKTNYLDITPNIDTAIFFANYDFTTNSVLHDDFAYIHYFDFEIDLINVIYHYPVYDLSRVSNLICSITGIKENRPMNQSAFSIKLLFKSGVDWLNAQKKTIRIKRSTDTIIHNRGYIYPVDNLYFYLKSQELNYFFYIMSCIDDIDEPLKSFIIKKATDFTFNKDSIR